jgi:transcriptional regulator with XRE-family HTH domain
MNETILLYIGSTIRTLRRDAEKSREEVATATGLMPCYISGVETGHRFPLLPFFERLAPAINQTTSAIIAAIENAAFPNG